MHFTFLVIPALAFFAPWGQATTAVYDHHGSGICALEKVAQKLLNAYTTSAKATGPFSYTGSYKIGCWGFGGGAEVCGITCTDNVQSICMVTRDMDTSYKYDSTKVIAYAQELIDTGMKGCGSIAFENNSTIGGAGNGYLSFRYTEETQCLDYNHAWNHYTECGSNQQG